MRSSFCRLLALLLPLVLTSCDPVEIFIETPTHLTIISGLSGIEGRYEGNLSGNIKLYLLRYSDGKYWNGNSWGGTGSAILPTQVTTSNSTWRWQGTPAQPSLPSGAALDAGYYNIIVYARLNSDEVRTDCVFSVGVSTPPVTSAIFAWGKNDNGQLGLGGIPDTDQPTEIKRSVYLDGKVVTALASGESQSLALTHEGRVYAWGRGDYGSLGRGVGQASDSDAPVPIDMSGALSMQRVVAVGAGSDHSLAVTSDGRVYAWGSNVDGQLGNGTTTGIGVSNPSPLPVTMTQLGDALYNKKVVEAKGGKGFTVVRTEDGQLFAWGANDFGQLGTGNTTSSTVPVAVTGLVLEYVASFSVGSNHVLAVTRDGELYAWGRNLDGELGNGGTSNQLTPLRVGTTGSLNGKLIASAAAGSTHSLALDREGKVHAWGAGEIGNGNGDTALQTSPVQLGGGLSGKTVTLASANPFGYGIDRASLAVTDQNEIYAWGRNYNFQLAGACPVNSSALVPARAVKFDPVLTEGRKVQQLVCGKKSAYMLRSPPPILEPEIEVEAQGEALADGTGPGVDFGAQSYGASSPVYFTVRNTGKSDLAELDATIDGPHASDYSVIFAQPPLAPGSSTGFYVSFKPNPNASPAPTSHTATLHIVSNDADEGSFEIPLTGTGYPAGKPEAGFNAGANDHIITTAVQPNGDILLGGAFTTLQPVGTAPPQQRGRIGRLHADGTLDTSFHPNANARVHVISVQRDGKILVGGEFTAFAPNGGASVPRILLARLNANGTVDTGFVANVNGLVRCILPLPNGKILIGGQFTTVDNGTGAVTRHRIALLDENGMLDTGFNPSANGEVLTMALDAQRRLIVGGYFSNIGGATRYRLARLDSNGAADDFSPVSSSYVYAVAAEADGSVLVGGDFTEALPGGGTASNLLRVKPDGTLDNAFRPNPGYRIQGINVQADHSIIVSGSFTSAQPAGDPTVTTRNRMARFFPDGSLDVLFHPDANGEVYGCALQADGRIIPAGSFTTLGGENRYGTARLSNNAVTDVLTVPSLSHIEWQRGGSAPQTVDVSFDLSTDAGITWTPLTGSISRTVTGWEMTGITLPSTGRVRARARAASGNHNGSSGLVEKISVFGEPPDVAVLKDGLPIVYGHSHDFGVVGTGSASSSIVLTIENNGGGPLSGLRGYSLVGSSQFSISGPASGTVVPGGSTTLSVLFQPRTTGIHAANLLLNSNDPDTPTFVILLSGSGGLPVTTWKQIHHGQTENTGTAADSATPANDGMTNLEKYARNLDPHVPATRQDTLTLSGSSSSPPPDSGEGEIASDAPVMHYQYTRNKLALADVLFQVEWSDSLATNDWHTTDVTEEIVTDDGQQQEVKATIPLGSAGRRFVRLKMTRR